MFFEALWYHHLGLVSINGMLHVFRCCFTSTASSYYSSTLAGLHKRDQLAGANYASLRSLLVTWAHFPLAVHCLFKACVCTRHDEWFKICLPRLHKQPSSAECIKHMLNVVQLPVVCAITRMLYAIPLTCTGGTVHA